MKREYEEMNRNGEQNPVQLPEGELKIENMTPGG